MVKRKPTIRREQFLAQMLEYLTDSGTRLTREMTAGLRTERESNREECMDSCDLASNENEQEMNSMLCERDALKIAQIGGALRRIALLIYGHLRNVWTRHHRRAPQRDAFHRALLRLSGGAGTYGEDSAPQPRAGLRKLRVRQIHGQENNGQHALIGSGNESILNLTETVPGTVPQ
jgi:hypothetical protein